MPYGTPQSSYYAARGTMTDGNPVRNRSSEQRFSGSGNPAMPIFNTAPPVNGGVRAGGPPVSGNPVPPGGNVGGPVGYGSDGTYVPPAPVGGTTPGVAIDPGNPAVTPVGPYNGGRLASGWNPALRKRYQQAGATQFQPAPMPQFNGNGSNYNGSGYRPPPPAPAFDRSLTGLGGRDPASFAPVYANNQPFMPAMGTPTRGIPGSVHTWGSP